jgi:FAD/FMN-containing dehydrogenase
MRKSRASRRGRARTTSNHPTFDISIEDILRPSSRRPRSHAVELPPAQAELTPEQIEFLMNSLVGHVVLPGDDTYEASRRVFNRRFNPHPSAILYCMAERDVRLCLDTVRKRKTPFRLRAGGNSFAGYSGGDGVIIDVSELNDVSIDPVALVATVGAGCSLAKLQAVLDDAGVHLPLGNAKDVRVAGFMQGGGFGLTSRTYGMNSDNVLEVRVMLADGRVVRATDAVNHDLWWAVRGGTGGNFGVLLFTRYRLRRAPKLHPWCLGWRLWGDADLDHAVSALMAFQEAFMRRRGSRRMNVSATVLYLAQTPDDVPGTPWMVIWGTYVGRESEMDAKLEPLLSNPGCWPRFQPILGRRYNVSFDRCSRLSSRTLTSHEWRAILSHYLRNAPDRQSTLQIDVWGGAISTYPRENSAFIHRDARFNISLTAWWQNETQEKAAKAFVASWGELVAPFWNGHIYQNFPTADAPDYEKNYWGPACPALAAIKQKYDPDRVFDFPQAIKPGPKAGVTWPPKVAASLLQPIR